MPDAKVAVGERWRVDCLEIGIGFPAAGFFTALMLLVASLLGTGLLIVLPSTVGGVDVLRAIQKLLLGASFEGVGGTSRFSIAFSLGWLVVLGRGLSITGGNDGGSPCPMSEAARRSDSDNISTAALRLCGTGDRCGT